MTQAHCKNCKHPATSHIRDEAYGKNGWEFIVFCMDCQPTQINCWVPDRVIEDKIQAWQR